MLSAGSGWDRLAAHPQPRWAVSFDQGTCHHLGWGDSGDVTFAAEMIEPICTCLGVLVAAHQRQLADGEAPSCSPA
jgi:hypothetical protein